MSHKTKDTIRVWAVGITGAVLAMLLIWAGPVSDPALPKVVYDNNGVPWTQDGERIEEDHPLWDCAERGKRVCED